MLRELKELVGRTVVARDGDIGEVKDVYFDDEAWGVRYLVTDIGSRRASADFALFSRGRRAGFGCGSC
jgi:sporulation protein YlmC with PRC-barrel domain